ncbi:hypothetical protein H4R34_006295, partial [Dimargaris verticillata]
MQSDSEDTMPLAQRFTALPQPIAVAATAIKPEATLDSQDNLPLEARIGQRQTPRLTAPTTDQ